MDFPVINSCFCYDLKDGGQKLGYCEIIIGVLNMILAFFFYIFNFETIKDLPNLIWIIFAFVNRKHKFV